ncbi:MAG: 6-phosphofructokinase [bacterium]|nr:6-phosphofructokinase [bacterium]
MKKIGIITSGGDCGGLNAVVKGVAKMAGRKGIKTYVIPNGYAGLYNLENFSTLVELTDSRLDTFSINVAGSEAGHSRVKISKIEDEKKYDKIKNGLKKFNLDGLVISGGDDTGSVVLDLSKHGIKCVHVPKTMDLDLMPYSVGGDSAIERIAGFVRDIKTTGRTHNRIMVLEVFGRYAGHTAFRGGVAGECDAILIPEIPVDFQELYRHLKKVYTKRVEESDVNAGTYTIVVSEGVKDASGKELYDESAGVDSFGHKKLAGAGQYVVQEIKKLLKEDEEIKKFMVDQGMFVAGQYALPEVRSITPSHLVRCGFTSSYDVNFGMEAGAAAVYLLLEGIDGVTITGYQNNHVNYMAIAEAIKQRYVDLKQVEIYEQLGFCFGRVRQEFAAGTKKMKGQIDRIY